MIDFVKLAAKYHVPCLDESGHHHAATGWVQTHCPWCASGRSGWHLGYSKISGVFNCWRCGRVDFKKTLRALLNCDDQKLFEIIREFQTARHNTIKQKKRQVKEVESPPGTGPMIRQHKNYLRSRNFDPDHLEQTWGLRGTQMLSGSWNWRVVYPIRDADGRVMAWQGRSIGDAKPKYKLTETDKCGDDPSSLVYGLEAAKGDAIIIVEGATGVWRLGAGSVALLGIDWKIEQANRLRQYRRRFILFDPEPQAQVRAEELAVHLSLFDGDTEVLSGFDTDPGEFNDELVSSIRREVGL